MCRVPGTSRHMDSFVYREQEINSLPLLPCIPIKMKLGYPVQVRHIQLLQAYARERNLEKENYVI